MKRLKTILSFGFVVLAVSLLVGFTTGTTKRSATVDPNGSLIVAIDQPFGSLDPRINHASLNARPLWNLFDGIVTKTWFSGADRLTLTPGLASSWTITDRSTVYTFTLRRGIKFADGTPFNAAAVVFNFRTMFDPTFEYYYPPTASFAKSYLPTYRDVAAIGPYKFRLRLTRPDGSALDQLAVHQEFFQISPAAIKQYGNTGIAQHPIGTGPFTFESFNASTQTMVATRNDSYWRGPSKVKTLVMRTITDQGARTAALEGKTVNVATNISVNNKARWSGRKDIKLLVRDQPTVKTCHLDWRSGPGANKLFRQAISLAIDRKSMASIVYGGLGGPAHGYFPPQSAAYDPKMPALAFNLTRAKSLLTQSGVKPGTTITYETATGDQNATTAFSVMQENLRALGINVVIKYVDGATFVRDLTTAGGIKPNSGFDGLCRTTLGTDTVSLLFAVFGKAGWPPAGFNAEMIEIPAVEAAYSRARNARDNDRWVKAHSDANQALVNESAALFLINDVQGFGMTGNVVWTPAAARAYMYYSAKVLKR